MKKFSNCLRTRYGDALVNKVTCSIRDTVDALVHAAVEADEHVVRLVNADKPFTGELGLFATGLTITMDDVVITTEAGDDGLQVVVCTTITVNDVMPHIDLVPVTVDVNNQLVHQALVATVPLGNVAWAERVLRYIAIEILTRKKVVD